MRCQCTINKPSGPQPGHFPPRMPRMLTVHHSGPAQLRIQHTEALLIAQSLRDIACSLTGHLLLANPLGSLHRQNVRRSAPCLGHSPHTFHQRSSLRQLHIQCSSRQCCHRLARVLFRTDTAGLPCSPVRSRSQLSTRTHHRRVVRLCWRSKHHLHSCGSPLRTVQLRSHLHPVLSTWYMTLRKAPRQKRRCTMCRFLLKRFQGCIRLHISQKNSH